MRFFENYIITIIGKNPHKTNIECRYYNFNKYRFCRFALNNIHRYISYLKYMQKYTTIIIIILPFIINIIGYVFTVVVVE